MNRLEITSGTKEFSFCCHWYIKKLLKVISLLLESYNSIRYMDTIYKFMLLAKQLLFLEIKIIITYWSTY